MSEIIRFKLNGTPVTLDNERGSETAYRRHLS